MFTDNEIKIIMNYAEMLTGSRTSKKFKKTHSITCCKIADLIKLYGNGDKPSSMNRVEYWISQNIF